MSICNIMQKENLISLDVVTVISIVANALNSVGHGVNSLKWIALPILLMCLGQTTNSYLIEKDSSHSLSDDSGNVSPEVTEVLQSVGEDSEDASPECLTLTKQSVHPYETETDPMSLFHSFLEEEYADSLNKLRTAVVRTKRLARLLEHCGLSSTLDQVDKKLQALHYKQSTDSNASSERPPRIESQASILPAWIQSLRDYFFPRSRN